MSIQKLIPKKNISLYYQLLLMVSFKGDGLVVKEKLAQCGNLAFCRLNPYLFSTTIFLDKTADMILFGA